VHHLGYIGKRQRQAGVADDDGLGFGKQALAHGQADREINGLAVFFGGAEPGHLPHLAVCRDQPGGRNRSRGGPHAFLAEGQLDIVLGKTDLLLLLQRRSIALGQRSHVIGGELRQAGVIAIRRQPGRALARCTRQSGARCKTQDKNK
jgi:hypothetical protein